MAERPTGAVTFLFTDIEGSTQAWETDPTGTAAALEIHDRILRDTIESHGGFVFATGGDSFSAAFSSPTSALNAAAGAQRALAVSDCGLRVRMGVHSGETVERDGNYFGPALNRTARLMSIGHGGQILVSTTTRDLVTAGDFEFIDLGEHRLADLSTPARIAQLVAEGIDQDFPELRSVVATDNLPRLGQVFGRDSDIEEVTGLLGVHRLVTLTGAGGIGKTTLATSVAGNMVDPYPDGRWLVDLTDLPPGSERNAISGAVAGVDDRFASVEALAPRQMLLILDNCEHVLDGVRSYLDVVLDIAPEVAVLATSREPIGVRGERVLPVAPLSVDQDSAHASAVDLFVTRATEAGVTLGLDTDRVAIAAICQQVGGLPLAIELAAARTAVMTPNQILDRLSDRLSLLQGGRGGPEHHRTIEATIAWSYDLLDEGSQRLFRFLSVFEGGFDLEQAEAVDGDGAVDRLTDLVRKSLVNRDGNRFGMLEAVRQFATARLRERGEESEARRLHFEFFADWAHEVYHREAIIRLTEDERRWMTDNLSNLRRAVENGLDVDAVVAAAEIALVLWPHWIDVFYDRWESHDWFEPFIENLDRLDPEAQMGVLHGSGTIRFIAGDLDAAHDILMQEYGIHRRTGLFARSNYGGPQNNLANLAAERSDWGRADHLYQEGIAVAENAGRRSHAMRANYARFIRYVHDDPIRALAVIQEGKREATTPWGVADELIDEATLTLEAGHHSDAQSLIEQALTHLRNAETRPDLERLGLFLLSVSEYEQGRLVDAVSLLLDALELEATERLTPFWQVGFAGFVAGILIDLGVFHEARRVLDTEAPLYETVEPVRQRRRMEVAARLPPPAHDRPPTNELRLLEAVIHALQTATR